MEEIICFLIHILFSGLDRWGVGKAKKKQGKEFLDRGRRLQAEGRFEEAARAFRAGLYIDPENEQLRGALEEPQMLRASLNNLAELYRAQGKYAEAEPLQALARHLGEGPGTRPLGRRHQPR